MWLLQEGKDEEGIVKLLVNGIRQQNEMALDLLIEIGAPDIPFVHPKYLIKAANIILEINKNGHPKNS